MPIYQIVQRGGGSIICFDLHRNQGINVTDKEVHFKRRVVAPVEIQLLVSGFDQHLSYNVLIDGALVGPEVLVGAEILLRFLVKRCDQQAGIVVIYPVIRCIIVAFKGQFRILQAICYIYYTCLVQPLNTAKPSSC